MYFSSFCLIIPKAWPSLGLSLVNTFSLEYGSHLLASLSVLWYFTEERSLSDVHSLAVQCCGCSRILSALSLCVELSTPEEVLPVCLLSHIIRWESGSQQCQRGCCSVLTFSTQPYASKSQQYRSFISAPLPAALSAFGSRELKVLCIHLSQLPDLTLVFGISCASTWWKSLGKN